jgi:hypothetical protein
MGVLVNLCDDVFTGKLEVAVSNCLARPRPSDLLGIAWLT